MAPNSEVVISKKKFQLVIWFSISIPNISISSSFQIVSWVTFTCFLSHLDPKKSTTSKVKMFCPNALVIIFPVVVDIIFYLFLILM